MRVPELIYNITFGFSGTTSRFSYSLNPILRPAGDILRCCWSADRPHQRGAALRPGATQQSEEVLLRQALSRMLMSPISAPVSRFWATLGIETVIFHVRTETIRSRPPA